MTNNINIKGYRLLAALLIIVAGIGCKKYVPQERETVGYDSRFTQEVYEPILGRTTIFSNNFFRGSSTNPSSFKLINPRRRNGDEARELLDTFPVKVWKQAYTGEEKTLAEIEAKRVIQYRPLFELNEHSGEFIMWAEGKSAFMRTLPDSAYLFDVEYSNNGGRRYFRNLKLMPYKERPYEPSNYNVLTGMSLTENIGASRIFLIQGAKTGRSLGYNDIEVYIRKNESLGLTGNTLTFKFLDTLYKPMDPALFADTDWPNLLHGFNMIKTNTSVTYSVAYPIPLTKLPTKYTNTEGTRANVNFGYSRLGFAGITMKASFGLSFAIYEPGSWEIVFAFVNENPKFKND